MMLFPKKRAWIAITALVLMAAAGAAIGYLLGRQATGQEAESRLAGEARQIEGEVDSFVQEATSLLSVLNASKFPPCSDAEIAQFREFVFKSVALRDAGRMRDGKIECSALFAKEKLPRDSFKPTMVRSDGTIVYVNLPPYRFGRSPVFALQHGESYVVQDPSLLSAWRPGNRKFEQTVYDSVTRKWIRPSGLPTEVPGAIRDMDSQGRVRDTLYATVCSPRSLVCTTTSGSFSAALLADRGRLIVDSSLGSVIGFSLALILNLIRQRNRRMDRQLRRAILKEKVRVVYQPIVSLPSGVIVGAEALARWTDEEGFAVSPEVFVKLAEERGFVGEITRLVVRHSVRDFREALRCRPGFLLSINVATADLTDAGFLPMLEEILEREQIPPQSLAVEITERSTASHDLAKDAISALRRKGIRVHIDDFGTGYSSLSYLHALSIDAIKIDKSFTRTIGTEAITLSILPQILAMAETLKLNVIVEGVETEPQAVYLSTFEQPLLAQGWYFGLPVPADEFVGLLAEADKKATQQAHVA